MPFKKGIFRVRKDLKKGIKKNPQMPVTPPYFRTFASLVFFKIISRTFHIYECRNNREKAAHNL
jgi:hypothetical protein